MKQERMPKLSEELSGILMEFMDAGLTPYWCWSDEDIGQSYSIVPDYNRKIVVVKFPSRLKNKGEKT